MKPMVDDPICRIEWKHVDSLNPNSWNPNVVLTKELRLLEYSILASGWIQPILVNGNGIIIDGFHRWTLAKTSKQLQEKYDGQVPCVILGISDAKAMLQTIRINRAKGSHVACRMSEIIKRLVNEFDMPTEQIEIEIGAHPGEVALLYQDSIFKEKGVDKVPYSPAWEPRQK